MSSTTRNPPALNSADIRRIVRGVRAFGSRPGLRRHIWTAAELQELCGAYMEHSRQMPLWKIAEMLHFSFSYPKKQESDDHEQQDDHQQPCRHPGYAVVPSMSAITSKLMSCVYLETGGELGYTYIKPSELQTQVWEHLLQSRQHRSIIQTIKSSSASSSASSSSAAIRVAPSTPIKIKREEEEEDDSASRVAPGAPVKPKQQARVRISIGRVRVRDLDDEEEFKSEQPPAKRRKIIFDDDDEMASETPTEIQTYTPTATSALQFQFDEVSEALSVIEEEISRDNIPADTTSAADMMYDDHDGDHDDHGDYDAAYAYEQYAQQQRETHAAVMAALNRISAHEQQIGELSSRVSGVHTEIEMIRRAIAEEVATLTGMFNLNPEQVGATDDADADDMSECDGEYCDHGDQGQSQSHYFVDGHQVSSWIYDEEYDEPPRYGDYDHHEECS